jgi:MurNAc alpha-1-phosphate uridylyltransferase
VAEGGERLTYSGVALMRPQFLKGALPGRFPLLPWLKRALDCGRLGGQRHAGMWLDVGTPERLAQLDATLARVGG